ncbi:hypothetical protein Pan1_76 [Pseudanabaena phage Pan1]|nr:hypothetical protein Pan1_76 [Pseudanabaena phage Pan1]
MGEVIALPQRRPSKADIAFAPIVSQFEIDTAEAAQRCAALAVKLRWACVIGASIAYHEDMPFLAVHLVAAAFLARRIVHWVKGAPNV